MVSVRLALSVNFSPKKIRSSRAECYHRAGNFKGRGRRRLYEADFRFCAVPLSASSPFLSPIFFSPLLRGRTRNVKRSNENNQRGENRSPAVCLCDFRRASRLSPCTCLATYRTDNDFESIVWRTRSRGILPRPT